MDCGSDYLVTLKNLCDCGDVSFCAASDEYISTAYNNYVAANPEICDAKLCNDPASTDTLGRIISGTVDQSDQSFLDSSQVDDGFVIVGVAYPTSDVVIEMDDSIYEELGFPAGWTRPSNVCDGTVTC